MPTNYKQLYAIQKKNEQRIKEICPNANEDSGIYMFYRVDEDGIKRGYIGQSVNLIQRLASHLSGWQHIDLSIKRHGLYSEDNPCGWKIHIMERCPKSQLDEREQYWILECQKKGIQMGHNKTGGSQGVGKEKINEYKPAKSYRDGIEQGKKSLAKELRNIIDKHLIVDLKPEKKNNKVSIKAFEKFKELIYGDI